MYLVGTAHTSPESRRTRSTPPSRGSVKPDVVFVELCRARADAMRSGARDDRAGALPEPLRQLLRSLGAPGDLGGSFSAPD